ncbi:MAG: [protein-PII] uridylyltransferase [Desulfobacterales bacterium]|nr:[protein-PII] uridylyltransferase [Desulfobacterales bacterium]
MERYTGILDDYFRESFEKSSAGFKMGIDRNPYVISALGGYGRKEQCIHSDVDFLFLFDKKVPKIAENLIREVVYPLWDIGLDVGYAMRSLKECISLSRQDFNVLTPLLDARFICGMSPLYFRLMEQIRWEVIFKQSQKIIDWLVESNQERHKHFGDSTYLLEPNIKDGQGGLRDYHTMLWIARIKFNLQQAGDLELNEFFSQNDFQSLNHALVFIWNVRNRLHHLTGRKCDQLYFEYQVKLAEALKFNPENDQQPVEKFLGVLHGQMEFIKQLHRIFLHDLRHPRNVNLNKKTSNQQSSIIGLEIKNERLCFTAVQSVLNSPNLLIRIFEESARLKIALSPEARSIVKEYAYLIDEKIRTSAAVLQSFEKILSAPVSNIDVLDEILNLGLLTSLIPEFKMIINRIQYDEYHLYPVDKHLLHTVQSIKNFNTADNAEKEALCYNLYQELKNPKLLLWAALLHDIGKGGTRKNHSRIGAEIAYAIMIKLGYKSEDAETVSFLIKEHLLLIKTASRRDINDEETAIFCARKIKNIGLLKMLYLLTVADSLSTGPKAWNEWTSALLRDLFLKTLSILENGELATNEAVVIIENKKNQILSSTAASQNKNDLEALFNLMSPRYILYTPTVEILEHISLYKNLSGKDFTWTITKNPNSNTRTVKICAKDHPGLFSKIAGVFTLNGLDILEAQVYTWRNNIALDILEVTPPPDQIFEDKRWEQTASDLSSALAGELDLTVALNKKITASKSLKILAPERPCRVVVDNKSSSFFTIIEVFAYDFPGLLFGITDALFSCGLDIWIAKIATKVEQVVDVFYVRDFDGQKVDAPESIAAIEAAIFKVISRPIT